MNDAHRGLAALEAKNYHTAIESFTKALKSSQSPLWLTQRSACYQRIGQYDLALADADNAVLVATSRGKRELIAGAHLRRAIALHSLGRFGDARMCLHWVKKWNEKEKGMTLWIAKMKNDYDQAGGEDAECNKVTVKEIPDPVLEAGIEETDSMKPAKVDKGKGKEVVVEKALPVKEKSAPAAVVPTSKDKIRHEWYQSTNTVTIEIFAKGIPKEKAEILIEEESLEVSFPIPVSSSIYDFTVLPLFAPINTSKSSFRITPHKVEIILQKSQPGLKWHTLQAPEPIEPDETSSIDTPTTTDTPKTDAPKTSTMPAPIPSSVIPVDKPPVYPTSSKTGTKNWDTMEDGEAEEEDEGVDGFFKKLYHDAQPDARRAMVKSYQESGGTTLSMDWGTIGSKKTPINPPDGMEAKEY